MIVSCVVPENVHVPTPRRVTGNHKGEGNGSVRKVGYFLEPYLVIYHTTYHTIYHVFVSFADFCWLSAVLHII